MMNAPQSYQLLFPLNGPPNPPTSDNPEFSDLAAFRAVKIVDMERKASETLIGFEENSRFLQGKPHNMAAMSPIMSLDGQLIYIIYVQEPIVRKYKLKGNSVEWQDEFPLHPEVFHDQDPNLVNMNDMVERTTFEMDADEAAKVKFIHAYGEEFFSVYNPGKKAEDMQRFTITRHESGGLLIGGSKMVNEDLEPKDHLQYFRNGVKVGNDLELPPYFDEVLLGKGPYLWFSRNTRKDQMESDYITFYKVRVVAE